MKEYIYLERAIPHHIVKQIREDTIDESIETLKNSIPYTDQEDIIYGFSCAINRLEQLKEHN